MHKEKIFQIIYFVEIIILLIVQIGYTTVLLRD
jgi:hypothetical protein